MGAISLFYSPSEGDKLLPWKKRGKLILFRETRKRMNGERHIEPSSLAFYFTPSLYSIFLTLFSPPKKAEENGATRVTRSPNSLFSPV